MREFLYRKINWTIVIFSVIIFSLFIVVVLPKVSVYTERVVGGLGSADTSLFYDGHDLYEFAESYGSEGRSNYIFIRWTFDVLWPLVYMSFLMSLIVQLSKPLTKKWFNRLYVLPLLAVGFDLSENLLTTIVMINFPNKLYWIGNLASLTSLMKWISLSLSFAALLVVLVAYLIHQFNGWSKSD